MPVIIFLFILIGLHWLVMAFMGMQVNMNIEMTADMNVQIMKVGPLPE